MQIFIRLTEHKWGWFAQEIEEELPDLVCWGWGDKPSAFCPKQPEFLVIFTLRDDTVLLSWEIVNNETFLEQQCLVKYQDRGLLLRRLVRHFTGIDPIKETNRYNGTCPHCGSAAYINFLFVECPKGCS